MLFSDLILETIIFEVRYEPAYRFWDQSGSIMVKLANSFPKLKLVNANVSNVHSSWEDQGITLNFSHLKADVSQTHPGTLKEFKEVCGTLCNLIHEGLSVNNFTRVGARFQYVYPQKTIADVNEFLTKLPLMSVPPVKIQPFGKEVKEQQRLLRIEDGDRGHAIRIASAQREINLTVPKPITVDTSKFNPNVILLDLDCYTTKAVETSMLVAADYIRKSARTAEENLVDFLRE